MRRRVSDAAMVYLMGAASTARSSTRRAAAKFLLECLRVYADDEEVRECLRVAERAMPTVAKEAREIALEAGLQLG